MFGRRSTYQPKHALPVARSTERRSTFMVLLAMLLSSGLVVGTSASFDASNTEGASRFAMATLDRPTNLQGEMAGTGAQMGWLGATSPDDASFGYNILWADGGAPQATGVFNGNCSTVTYTKIGVTGGFSDTDANANNRFADPNPQGRWACYKVETVYPNPLITPTDDPWVSQLGNPVKAIQVGFVTATVALANGASNLTMAATDTITITFNQPVNTSTFPAEVDTSVTPGNSSTAAPRICAIHNNGSEEILIGAMGTGACNTSETVLVGRLFPSANRISANVRHEVSWDWVDSSCVNINACRQIRATIGTRIFGGNNTSLTTNQAWTFVPSSTLVSATGAQAICTVNPTGGLCRPQTTGNM